MAGGTFGFVPELLAALSFTYPARRCGLSGVGVENGAQE